MKKNFTNSEKSAGELAARRLSPEIRDFMSATDLLSLYEYIDYDATAKAEDEAIDNDIDFMPGALDVVRYAINDAGTIRSGLTFEQAETYLQDIVNASKEETEE